MVFMALRYRMLREIEYSRYYGFNLAIITIADYTSEISCDFKFKPLCIFKYCSSAVCLYRILHGPMFIAKGCHANYGNVFEQIPYAILMSEVI
jgi:hypothetical protein